jgi:hypothetical protein
MALAPLVVEVVDLEALPSAQVPELGCAVTVDEYQSLGWIAECGGFEQCGGCLQVGARRRSRHDLEACCSQAAQIRIPPVFLPRRWQARCRELGERRLALGVARGMAR